MLLLRNRGLFGAHGIDVEGGVVHEVGGYYVHHFYESGEFVVNRNPSNVNIEVFMIGAGGRGGNRMGGGGGGGRHFIFDDVQFENGTTYNVIVGIPTNTGMNLRRSIIENITAEVLGEQKELLVEGGGNGGNGGDAVGEGFGGDSNNIGGSGVTHVSEGWIVASGGGGGTGSPGNNATYNLVHNVYIGGSGGNGGQFENWVYNNGQLITRLGGGGGGGTWQNANAVDAASGGEGGGGRGGRGEGPNNTPKPGVTNSGGGGGGGGPEAHTQNGALGGSGLVLIRYPI